MASAIAHRNATIYLMRKGLDYTGITCVFLCHDGQGNILFSKRSKNCRDEWGTWDIGAGSMRFGETIRETLIREIREEYCVQPTDILPFGMREVFREHEGEKTHWLAFDHVVQVDRDQVAIGEPDKVDELMWTTIDNLPEPMHSADKSFFEQHFGEIARIVNSQ
tara:strand:- start:1044 stop:1535 length:492 start_codon:yes stop_codon:yes gene_type:complete